MCLLRSGAQAQPWQGNKNQVNHGRKQSRAEQVIKNLGMLYSNRLEHLLLPTFVPPGRSVTSRTLWISIARCAVWNSVTAAARENGAAKKNDQVFHTLYFTTTSTFQLNFEVWLKLLLDKVTE